MSKSDLVKPRKIIVGVTIFAIMCGLLYFLFFGQVPVNNDHFIRYRPRLVVAMEALQCESGWPSRVMYDGYVASDVSRIMDRLTYYDDALRNGEFAGLSILVCTWATQTGHADWRTLYRNGESIIVVYVSITETPFSLMRSRFSRVLSGTRRVPIAALDGIILPQRVEVYYLQNVHRIKRRSDRLSDEDFDALRSDGVPIWSGEIRLAE